MTRWSVMTGDRQRALGRIRLAAFVLTLGVVAAACSSSGATTPTPTTTAPPSGRSLAPFQTPTPTPELSPDSSGLNEQLVAYLPSAGAGAKCENASDAADRAAVARVKCVYKATNQTVWFSQYQDGDALDAAYSEQQLGTKTAGKGCEAARFHGAYTIDGTQAGQVACNLRGKDAWMVWTIDDAFILGEATRKGNTAKALYDWWHKNLPIGRTGNLRLTSTTPEPSPEPTTPDPSASGGY